MKGQQAALKCRWQPTSGVYCIYKSFNGREIMSGTRNRTKFSGLVNSQNVEKPTYHRFCQSSILILIIIPTNMCSYHLSSKMFLYKKLVIQETINGHNAAKIIGWREAKAQWTDLNDVSCIYCLGKIMKRRWKDYISQNTNKSAVKSCPSDMAV